MKKPPSITTICVSIFILTVVPASISRAQEVQIPFDREGKIFTIDSALESSLQFFTTYPGFVDARLFAAGDSTVTLEISYVAGNRSLRMRILQSPRQLDSLRAGINAILYKRSTAELTDSSGRTPEVALNQEGRTSLIVNAATLSIGGYGWAIPWMFDIQDERTYAGTWMLIGAAGTLLPWLSTTHSEVTHGDATLVQTGALLGLAHGLFISGMREERQFRTTVGTMSLVSIAESGIGWLVAKQFHIPDGRASVIEYLGLFGAAQGIGAGVLMQDDYEWKVSCELGIIGSAVGVVVGNALASGETYTAGDASVLSITGLVGAATLGDLSLGLGNGSDNEKEFVGALMLGNLGGLVIGHTILNGKELTNGDASLVGLGSLAGLLLGGALGAIFASSLDGPEIVSVTSTAGMIAGFVWAFNGVSAAHHHSESQWNLQFHPEGMASAILGKPGMGTTFVSLHGQW